MTLHYKTPEERKIHDNKRGADRAKKSREKKREELRQIVALCERLEGENHALVLQNEHLKAEHGQLKAMYFDAMRELEALRNAPPKIEFRDVPIKRPPPTCIGDVMQMVNYADATWLTNFTPEVEPKIQSFLKCPACGNKEGSFVDKMICY